MSGQPEVDKSGEALAAQRFQMLEDIAKELQMRHDPDWDKKRRVAKSKGEMK